MRWMLGTLLLSISLGSLFSSCQRLPRSIVEPSPAISMESTTATTVLWQGTFSSTTDWLSQWGKQDRGDWGLQNMQVIPDPEGQFTKILRVSYPAGSASPAVARKTEAPLGGAQFYANLNITPQTALRLSYYVRFSKNFDFVKGGKLPGLFGGKGNSGGKIPNGEDGFSTRFMWRRKGDGEVYAYLPTSKKYGTSIGRGNWRFDVGKWHHIEQEVVLNQPTQKNGRIRVWFDGKQVLDENDLTFRRVDRLKVEGLFFSTFFGGDDPSWATPRDVYIDFADFSVIAVKPSQ